MGALRVTCGIINHRNIPKINLFVRLYSIPLLRDSQIEFTN